MSNSIISHQGIVESIANNKISVKINSVSACSSCHAQGACSASDMQEKLIEAFSTNKLIKIGDWVTVEAKQSMGLKAVLLGYFLPFLLVIAMLIICTSFKMSEIKSGLLALATLVPYYATLFILRNKIKKSFIFEIKQ